jgi:hypothetical protein
MEMWSPGRSYSSGLGRLRTNDSEPQGTPEGVRDKESHCREGDNFVNRKVRPGSEHSEEFQRTGQPTVRNEVFPTGLFVHVSGCWLWVPDVPTGLDSKHLNSCS